MDGRPVSAVHAKLASVGGKSLPSSACNFGDEVPHKDGLSGPELIASVPDPTLKDYVSRFDANNLAETFRNVGIKALEPRSSVLGIGHVVLPGTIDMAIRDGELYALLPGKHAYRTHGLQPKPYEVLQTISFEEASGAGSQQHFDGGMIFTLGPSEVGFCYNVPTDEIDMAGMGRGVVMIPPGTWIIRSPILVAKRNFEATTAGTRPSGRGQEQLRYIQELDIGVMDMAKPRLVYVPYNHAAIFIDGRTAQICDQGFHWASPGIEIAGPWPQHEQRFCYSINAKTLDNMVIKIEAECWVQMVNPERYVKVAGKEAVPEQFLEDKLSAKVKQHVAQINALQMRPVEVPMASSERVDEGDFEYLGDSQPAMGVAVAAPEPPTAASTSSHTGPQGQQTPQEDVEEIIVTKAEDSPTEFQVFNRMKSLLDEVRGFVDGRNSAVVSLANQVQDAIGRAGLQLISLAALSVNLPEEITAQIQEANEEQIRAQTEQATNHAKAQKHIAEKYAQIRKKKADREEETKDAENQVTLQRTKARLAEAEEFAKRQAKRAEQKVEQSLELQALEHKMVREQQRIENELRLLAKEQELLDKQEEMEDRRLRLAEKVKQRDCLVADAEAYKIQADARAQRERVNMQTLVDSIMANLGRPLTGSKIVTLNGGSADAGSEGSGGVGMLPQMLALKEILGEAGSLAEQNQQQLR